MNNDLATEQNMNQFLNGMVRAVAETFDFPEPIVEIGSFQVPGQEALADLRGLFPGKKYVGLDARPGPGVDCIADVEDLPYADASVGSVIAMNTFEHVPQFWRGFEEVRRVLRPDGVFFVSCPFSLHIHNCPNDYWRFTPDAMQWLLQAYPSKIFGWRGPRRRPADVWALAFREGQPPITEDRFRHYQHLLKRYAHQPMRWKQKLRCHLGRWLCGRGLLAPYLDRNHWETECQTAMPSP